MQKICSQNTTDFIYGEVKTNKNHKSFCETINKSDYVN